MVVFNNEMPGKLGDSCSKEIRGKELELPLFDMSTIESATDDFSFNNKLGEGGFGPVYKVTDFLIIGEYYLT